MGAVCLTLPGFNLKGMNGGELACVCLGWGLRLYLVQLRAREEVTFMRMPDRTFKVGGWWGWEQPGIADCRLGNKLDLSAAHASGWGFWGGAYILGPSCMNSPL